jgi:parallel beta-helix repeat protein
VLFEGGSTFSDDTLMPPVSGGSGTPVTFSSYGSGRATISNAGGAVWFSGKSHLTFSNLVLTTGGSSTGVFAGSGGGASTDITLRDSVVRDTSGMGVCSPNTGDSRWTIAGNTITNTGDSGVLLLGANDTVSNNTISHTGWNAAITWGKHGIYAKGPDVTISGNDFSDNPHGQSISIRFHGARVVGNTIHDTGAAIGFFDYDTAVAPQGTSYVYGNRGWNITEWVFYYAGELDPHGVAPSVNFVVASNTFELAGASEAVNVSESGSAKVTLANNVFTGSYGSALRSAASTVEHHNLWYGWSSNRPHGDGDLFVAPALSAPGFVPGARSFLMDAGSAANAGLTYTASCSGAPLSYCGSNPDLGAVESSAPTPAPAPAPAPPSNLVVGAITGSTVSLGWTGSTDARTVGYRVTQNGTVIGSPTGNSLGAGGLTCNTAYTFSVVAVDSSGTASTPATATATTAACSPPSPVGVGATNDAFGAAVLLTGSSGSAAGDTTRATREAGEPLIVGNSGGHSLWYSWTAPSGGRTRVDTSGSAFDTTLAVYTGNALGSLTKLAENDDVSSTNHTSKVRFTAVAGTTYRIQIDGFTGTSHPPSWGALNVRWVRA